MDWRSMSNKTITKILPFVILAMCTGFSVLSCGLAASGDRRRPDFDEQTNAYDKPRIVGEIKSAEINESSGLAASPCQPNVLWTHNDSGDGPYIFAIDSSGANLGTWKVQDAVNTDWEDLAPFKDTNGQCFLFIGEIGNTEKAERTEHKIYRVKEPLVSQQFANSNRNNAAPTEPADTLTFRYSDASHDAESLLVHPRTGDIYILTKHRNKPSSIYQIKPDFSTGGVTVAQKISEIAVPAIPNGFLTGGSISPDGTRVILCDYAAAYELSLPSGAANFDEIWKQKPLAIDLGSRKQGEAISYNADGTSIFATSEKRGSPLIEVKRK